MWPFFAPFFSLVASRRTSIFRRRLFSWRRPIELVPVPTQLAAEFLLGQHGPGGADMFIDESMEIGFGLFRSLPHFWSRLHQFRRRQPPHVVGLDLEFLRRDLHVRQHLVIA